MYQRKALTDEAKPLSPFPNMENQTKPTSEPTTGTQNQEHESHLALARMWQALTPAEREGVKQARDVEAARRLGITPWQFQCDVKGNSGSSMANK